MQRTYTNKQIQKTHRNSRKGYIAVRTPHVLRCNNFGCWSTKCYSPEPPYWALGMFSPNQSNQMSPTSGSMILMRLPVIVVFIYHGKYGSSRCFVYDTFPFSHKDGKDGEIFIGGWIHIFIHLPKINIAPSK